ncbi:hypothetical protein ACOME3_000285 [Neoechinorhynchus agilis]
MFRTGRTDEVAKEEIEHLLGEQMADSEGEDSSTESQNRDDTDSELHRLLQQYRESNAAVEEDYAEVEAVRKEQERIARTHERLLFPDGSKQSIGTSDTQHSQQDSEVEREERRERSRKNMKEIMSQLDELGEAIDALHLESIDVDRYKL